MEYLEFIFKSFWHFIGFLLLAGGFLTFILKFWAIFWLGANGKLNKEDLED